MTISVLKLIYKFNMISIKIKAELFIYLLELDRLILKSYAETNNYHQEKGKRKAVEGTSSTG